MGRTGMAYRRLRANFTDRPTLFSWVREGKLAASGRPYSKAQVDWLKRSGVNAVLSLTEDPLPPGWVEGIEAKHISLKDHAPVSHQDMLSGAEYIHSSVEQGKVVLVHCLAGKGRTGSVLAAYLMVYEGMTAREAIDDLRRSRGGSVEAQQEQAVLEFEVEAVRRRRSTQTRGTTRRSTP
ncbi:MAG: dual specificity protein phosphatase family protein [Nitrososphaerota archaeon]|nr:dual specificity protein phosphatase family protein [Nitrososphaerota archaeon]